MEREIFDYLNADIEGQVFLFTDENMQGIEKDARDLIARLEVKQFETRCEIRRGGYVADVRISDEIDNVAGRVLDIIEIVKHGGQYVEDWGMSKAAKWNIIDQALADAEWVLAQ